MKCKTNGRLIARIKHSNARMKIKIKQDFLVIFERKSISVYNLNRRDVFDFNIFMDEIIA